MHSTRSAEHCWADRCSSPTNIPHVTRLDLPDAESNEDHDTAMMDTATITGMRFQHDSSSGKCKMVRRGRVTPTLLLCISKFPIPKFPINRFCSPSLTPDEDPRLQHSGMLHLALVLLPLPWQCLSPGPGVEGAVTVGNDSTSLNLLILDFLSLHPTDTDGPGAESVHVARQHQDPMFHFSVHMDVRECWEWDNGEIHP